MENSSNLQIKVEKTGIHPTLTKHTSLPSYGEVIEPENQHASETLENFDGKMKRKYDKTHKKEGSELKVMANFSGK